MVPNTRRGRGILGFRDLPSPTVQALDRGRLTDWRFAIHELHSRHRGQSCPGPDEHNSSQPDCGQGFGCPRSAISWTEQHDA